MTTCIFPSCTTPPTTANRRNQPTCPEHVVVVVTGSFVADRHTEGSGE